MPVDKERIFKHFKGMNAYYEKEAGNFKRFMAGAKGTYTDAYIYAYKKTTLDDIVNDKKERVQAAIDEIAKIKAEMKEKKFKDPYAALTGPIIKAEDKMLIELRRMMNLQFFRAEMDAANNAADLKNLHDQFQDDADFYRLFQSEMKKRINSSDGLQYQKLDRELDMDPPEFSELTQIESGLKMIANSDMYPAGLEENGFSDIGFKTLSLD